jgi:hypothetical protein
VSNVRRVVRQELWGPKPGLFSVVDVLTNDHWFELGVPTKSVDLVVGRLVASDVR